MLTCKVGDNIINCYDGNHGRDQLKKWASKNILICPACGKSYEYCHGKIKLPYFRHKDKNECEDKYSEIETEEHIKGKLDLFEWIKIQNGVTDVVLEGWLSETKQRPDIMFKYNNKQYVIEYQCTPISSEYIERHELYKAAGINDIWICGTNKYIEKSEIGKSFRQKEIEKYINYHYDSECKIFMFSNIDNQIYDFDSGINKDYNDIKKVVIDNYLKNVSKYSYFKNDMREFIPKNSIIKSNGIYMTLINNVVFSESKLNIIDSIKKNIFSECYNELKEKINIRIKENSCNELISDTIYFFNKECDKNAKLMFGEQYGFKCNGSYYKLDDFCNYPNMKLYKIKYFRNNKDYIYLFDVDMYKNPLTKIIEYLSKK